TPCLGDIPILGWLFKTRSTGTKKTNLLIFLTPHVVRDQDELEKVSEKAKSKVNNARQGRFRIDVSNEFGIPQKQEGKEESDNESEEEESESEEEGTPIENPEAENKTAE
ncbi:MAG: hypothetical protein HOB38_21890, partial [Deltaproteobacteria bacterium]|nr:hypothetical protein [Deltaproteobacteria bacterium]